MTLPRLLITLCFLILSARVASADDPALRAAKRHFERGEKLYALTKFGDALDEYQKAFDAKPIPDFLFNIGQCYRNLGDYEAAIFSYRKYLKLEPDAPNREKVEQLITDLEAKQDQHDTRRLGLRPRAEPRTSDAAEDEDEDEAPPPARPFYKKWWFWTGVAGVALVGGGVTVYALTRPGDPPSTSLGNIVFGK